MTNEKIKMINKWLFSNLAPYKGLYLFLFLCSVFTNGLELLIPKSLQYFIDQLLPQKNIMQLCILTIVMALFILLMFITRRFGGITQRRVGEKAARDIQLKVLQQLRRLGFSYFERNPVGESLSLMNSEVSIVQDLYKNLLPAVMNSTTYCFIAVIMMITIDYKILFFLIPSILLYYAVAPPVERKAAVTVRDLSDSRIKFHQKVYESISAVKELKVNNAVSWELDRVNLKQSQHHGWFMKFIWYANLRGLIRRLLVALGGIAILVYGYWAIRHGEKTLGEVTALILYYNLSMLEITYLITGITEIRLIVYQSERLYSFLQLQSDLIVSETSEHRNSIVGEIDFKKVKFGYRKEDLILRDASFKIFPGQRVAFVGPSGEGKSTILKLLGRFYNPQGGEILIDGVPIERLELEQLRDSMGFVFQETYLFGLSVMDNIRFGKPDASDEDVYQAAKLAYAHTFIMDLPQGYNSFVGEKGSLLSGGQRQRISIARMLLKNPTIVIMDEPTSSLDTISESEIQQAMDTLSEGRTIIVVAHRLSTIKDFDTVYEVKDGKISERKISEEGLYGINT